MGSKKVSIILQQIGKITLISKCSLFHVYYFDKAPIIETPTGTRPAWPKGQCVLGSNCSLSPENAEIIKNLTDRLKKHFKAQMELPSHGDVSRFAWEYCESN